MKTVDRIAEKASNNKRYAFDISKGIALYDVLHDPKISQHENPLNFDLFS